MSSDEGSCCAHLCVKWRTEDVWEENVTISGDAGWTTRGWWACEDCAVHFAPSPMVEAISDD
jgi:hypothetical protein